MAFPGKKLFGRSENRVTPIDKKTITDNPKKKDKSNNGQKVSKFRSFFEKRKDKKDRFKAITRNFAETTSEIWLTFAFTFVVGTFLLGGGMYLIYDGATNNVVDFVVVGSFGILMGICFSSVGLYLFFKPICDSRKEKKERQKAEQINEHIGTMKQTQVPSYFTDNEANIMNLQANSSLVDRKPNNVDLYGKRGSRTHSASSNASFYDPPPPLAVPSKKSDSYDVKDAVELMEVRESTEDDIAAILQAASANDIKPSQIRSAQEAIEEVSRESTPISVVEHIQDNVANEPADLSPTRRDSPVRLQDSSAPEIRTALFELSDKDHAEKYAKEQKESGNVKEDSDESRDDEVLTDEDTPRKKKRVLSAVNERRASSARKGSDDIKGSSQDDKDTEPNTFSHGPGELLGEKGDTNAGKSLETHVNL